MKYSDLRINVVTGDIAMVSGFGLISKIIRALTGEKISHIAMFVWLGDGLFVVEFKEFKGFRLMPASIWVEDVQAKGNQVFYGQAPHSVREASSEIARSVFRWRHKHYGYLSLPKIWWSKITNKPQNVNRVVCSTYVADMWGDYYKFPYTPSPGSFMEYCEYSALISGL